MATPSEIGHGTCLPDAARATDSDDAASEGPSEEGEDEFEDAAESIQLPQKIDLATAVSECKAALNLFLNNKFDEALARLQPWAHGSMYHALGYGTMMYLQAIMTLEPREVETAVTALKQAIRVCVKLRKSTKFGRPNYDKYTDEEVHAELCYAESLLLRSILTFLQDENLISFIKGAMRIKQCYKSYQECYKILERRRFQDERMKMHFESGVRMGIGAFNLMISMLPPRILRLLEFVGFTGDKASGLADLEVSSNLHNGLRAPLASIILMSYHAYISQVLGNGDGNINFASSILKPCLEQFPKGALFLLFAARIQEVNGQLDEALGLYEQSIDSQSSWRHLHHLCYWQMMWCSAFKCEWLFAMKYAEVLSRESSWSKSTYLYLKGIFMLMSEDQSAAMTEHVVAIFTKVPELKVRVAGKSLPIEKFAIRRVQRFFAQGNRLTLPALEVIYIWNGFAIIYKSAPLAEPILQLIEAKVAEVSGDGQSKTQADDLGLCLLLKAMCLVCRRDSAGAEACLRELVSMEKRLVEDKHLVPYAVAEMGFLALRDGKPREAQSHLEAALNNYKGYQLESRLHFRLHAALEELKRQKDPAKTAGQSAAGRP